MSLYILHEKYACVHFSTERSKQENALNKKFEAWKVVKFDKFEKF